MIYVIDPTETDRKMVSALANRLGYSFIGFESAEDFLRHSENIVENACLITELDLPGLNGLDLVIELQQRGILIPVIILTRNPDVGSAVRACRAKVADYMIKPFVERRLANRIKKLLADRRCEPGSPEQQSS
jgi:two-component system response regulator FixJ